MIIKNTGSTVEFYHNDEVIKAIDKDILTFRTDGNNLIECLESGIATFSIYYDAVTSPSEANIIDLFNTLKGYL